jgi:orotidine-5'-phosphate decarboxylase
LTFGHRLAQAVRTTGAPLCLGLDPLPERLPSAMKARWQGLRGEALRGAQAEQVYLFNAAAIRAAQGRLPAVKLQFAFFEALGHAGWRALEQSCRAAREAGLLVIGDGKRGDIDSTAAAYAQAALDPEGPLGCDALTVNAWMGRDTLRPALEQCRSHGRGLFVLVRTTNPGSAEHQLAGSPSGAERMAALVAELGPELVGPEGLSSVGAVVGCSAAAEAQGWRAAMPQAWFLVPGLGAQGGTAAQVLAGRRPDGLGVLGAASRALLYPSEPSPEWELRPQDWIARQVERLVAELREIQG